MIHDGNRNNMSSILNFFEEHIAPKSNALIAIVELKRLFQSSMSLKTSIPKLLDWSKRQSIQRETH